MSNIRLQKLIEMLEQQPNDPFLTYAMAMEYLGLSNLTKAEELFKQVLLIEPNHLAVHYQLGILLPNLGKEAEAIIILERGLMLAQQKGDQKTKNEFRSALDELLY